MRTWREPHPSTAAVLLRLVAAGACVLAVAVSGVLANWDAAVVAAVLAGALVLDVWHDLRPRRLVVVGPDVVVVVARTSLTVPRDGVVKVAVRSRRLRTPRVLLVRRDGPPVKLPRGAPVEDLREWLAEPTAA